MARDGSLRGDARELCRCRVDAADGRGGYCGHPLDDPNLEPNSFFPVRDKPVGIRRARHRRSPYETLLGYPPYRVRPNVENSLQGDLASRRQLATVNTPANSRYLQTGKETSEQGPARAASPLKALLRGATRLLLCGHGCR